MKPIEIERLLKLLKQPIIAPETEIFLDELGVKRRPYLEPEDIDEGVYNQWLPIRKIGLELEFKHKNNFEMLNAGDMNSADLLLTTLIFYANHEDMRTYPYELPYGLKFDDSPKVVRSKLADKQCSKREYLRDVFEFDDHWLIVSYNNQRNAIDDITYMLISGKKVEAAPASYPVDIEYERLIHSKIDNPILTQLFPFVDFKQYIKNEYTHRDISKL